MKRTCALMILVIFASATSIGLCADDLLVYHVNLDRLETPFTETNRLLSLTDRPTVTATAPARSKDMGQRWQKFEAEFGIAQPSSSLLVGSLQNVKYQLDWTSFALHEFTETLADRFRFTYSLTDLGLASRPNQPAHTIPDNFVDDALSNLRLQTVIDLNVGEKSFVGVKLVLPVGN